MGFNNMMPIGEFYIAEWIEYEPAEDLDTENTYAETPIDFRFRQYVDDAGVAYPIPGMRTTELSYTIETSEDIVFKPLDIIRFASGKEFKIKSRSIVRQTGNNLATFQFPGAVDDYIRQIITL